jgi:hypothetical protein
MTSSRARRGRGLRASRKTVAAGAGAGVLLAACSGVLANLLTSNFSWIVAAPLIGLVLAGAGLAAWQYLAEPLAEPADSAVGRPGRGDAPGDSGIQVRQDLGRIARHGDVTGIDAAVPQAGGHSPRSFAAGQRARRVAGRLTGIHLRYPE